MEPVGFVASIIATVQVADRVIGLCKRLLEATRDAPADIRLILVEVSTVKSILDNLNFLSSCSQGPTALDSLVGDGGPVEGCRRSIRELEGLLETDPFPDSQSKTKAVLAVLSWAMKEAKAKKVLDQLREYKSTINLALASESGRDVKAIKRDVKDIKRRANKIDGALTDMQRQEVYGWLRSTDPSPLHHRSCKLYEPGTGEWLFRSPVWTSWLEGETRCIWIHGIPGAGKTIFASHLIETVKKSCEKQSSASSKYACVYYYCYFGHGQDEAIPFLKWILNKLCRQAGDVPDSLYQLYRGGGEPSVSDLLHALEDVVEDYFTKTYIFVDAVDESIPREDLLDILRDLATDPRFEKLRVLATSREYGDIENVLAEISVPISMRNPLLDEDIAVYVQSQLTRHPKLRRWPAEVQGQVLRALAMKAQGMFRWVVCQMDALQRLKPDSSVIATALANLPKTLDETYERIFLNVPEDGRLFVKHVLQWLHTHQNMHMVGNTVGMPSSILLQGVQRTLAEEESCEATNYEFDEDLLREFCGCLITLTWDRVPGGKGYVEGFMVSFAHYTVVEFLEAPRIRRGPAQPFELRARIDVECARALLLAAVGPECDEAWASVKQFELSEVRSHDTFSFPWYCLASSLVLLYRYSPELRSPAYASLMGPVCQLLQTAKRHFQPLEHVYYAGRSWMDDDINFVFETFHRASKTSFSSKPAEPAGIETFIYALQINASGDLGQNFLEPLGGLEHVMSTQLDLEFELDDNAFFSLETSMEVVVGFPGPKTWHFQGSVMEFYVHIPSYEPPRGLVHAFEYAAGYFDPSIMMLLFIGRSAHQNHGRWADKHCSDCLALKRLLELGAKPTVPGYAVGALQIAVSMRYLVGVKLLLDAGADPNDIGDLGGTIGTADRGPMLKWFERIRGKSPLNISRSGPFALRQDRTCQMGPDPDGVPAQIEALLLEHGAKDFVVPLEEAWATVTEAVSKGDSGDIRECGLIRAENAYSGHVAAENVRS